MRHCAKFCFPMDVAILFDDLERVNDRYKPTNETYGVLIEMCIVSHMYPWIPVFLDFAKSKKKTIDPALEKRAMELFEQHDKSTGNLVWGSKFQPEIAEEMPPRIRLAHEYEQGQFKHMMDHRVQAYQPPIHLLVMEDKYKQ